MRNRWKLAVLGAGSVAGLALTTAPSIAAPVPDSPRYAAIAYSPSTSHWGRGVGNASQAVADARALHYCRVAGAPDCAVRIQARGMWVALSVAWAQGPLGAGRAFTRQAAVDYAVGWCRHYGGGDACDATTTVDGTTSASPAVG